MSDITSGFCTSFLAFFSCSMSVYCAVLTTSTKSDLSIVETAFPCVAVQCPLTLSLQYCLQYLPSCFSVWACLSYPHSQVKFFAINCMVILLLLLEVISVKCFAQDLGGVTSKALSILEIVLCLTFGVSVPAFEHKSCGRKGMRGWWISPISYICYDYWNQLYFVRWFESSLDTHFGLRYLGP